MKGKNLFVLIVFAVALVAAAIFVRKNNINPPPDAMGKPLMPDLPVNDIEKVVISTASAAATLARVEGKWVCENRHGYPIDFGRLRDVLVDLYDAKIGDVVPAAAERLGLLGLIPPGEAAGDNSEHGTLVQLFLKGTSDPRSLLLGKTHMKKPTGEAAAYGAYADGRYVSTDSGKTVYLIADTLENLTITDPAQWIDADLLNIQSSDIREITITGPGREPIRIARETADSELMVDGLADDEEADTSKLNSINGALSYMRLSDIADPALPDEQLGMTSSVVFRATTKKDEVYTIRVGSTPKDGSDCYVRIDVAMAQPATEEKTVEDADEGTQEDTDEPSPDDTLDKKKAERQETEKAVAAHSRKVSGWTYLVASYKAESLTTKRPDLVKEREEAKEDEEKEE